MESVKESVKICEGIDFIPFKEDYEFIPFQDVLSFKEQQELGKSLISKVVDNDNI